MTWEDGNQEGRNPSSSPSVQDRILENLKKHMAYTKTGGGREPLLELGSFVHSLFSNHTDPPSPPTLKCNVKGINML